MFDARQNQHGAFVCLFVMNHESSGHLNGQYCVNIWGELSYCFACALSGWNGNAAHPFAMGKCLTSHFVVVLRFAFARGVRLFTSDLTSKTLGMVKVQASVD